MADDDAEALVSVQSVVVDPADRLWILDTGSPMFQPTKPGGPKMVCVDLTSDRVVRTIVFSPDVDPTSPDFSTESVSSSAPDTMVAAARRMSPGLSPK